MLIIFQFSIAPAHPWVNQAVYREEHSDAQKDRKSSKCTYKQVAGSEQRYDRRHLPQKHAKPTSNA
jgi:hypothetical protein